MVRAQARACAVSVTAGNSRRSSTAAENSPLLLVDGADRGGLSLGDDEHAGRMGTRTVGGKRHVVARLAAGSASRSASGDGCGRRLPDGRGGGPVPASPAPPPGSCVPSPACVAPAVD